MSAIKNYIEKTVPRYVYLYEKNYIEKSKIAPSAVFKEAKDRLLSQLSLKTSNEELNNLSNWYQQGLDLLAGFSKTDDGQRLQESIIQKLSEKFSTDLSEIFDFDFTKGAVVAKQGGSQNISRVKKVRTTGQLGLGNGADIINRSNKIISALTEVIENNPSNKKDLEKAVKQVQIIQDSFKDLFKGKDLKDAIKRLKEADVAINENTLQFFEDNKFQKSGKRIDYQTINAYVKTLNSVVAAFSSSILGHVQGLFEEYIMAAIAALADNVAGSVLEKFEDNLKQGGAKILEGTVDIFDPDAALKIIQDINKNGMQTPESKDMKVQMQVKYSSQQKADIVITIEGKTYPISVKNYARKQGKKIHLQSGSPLSTLLFGSDNINKNIGAHYLNILADHPRKFKHSSFSSVKKEGLEALILTMLYQAVSGQGVGKTSGFAEILAWNDPKDGTMRFFDINSLIAQLANENLLGLANKITKPSLATLKLDNPYIKGKQPMNEKILMRLSRVYADARSKKINIMIPQSILEKSIATLG